MLKIPDEKELKKIKCPSCGADLRDVGIKNNCVGTMYYDVTINDDKTVDYHDDDFESDGDSSYYCGDCDAEIYPEKLGLIL